MKNCCQVEPIIYKSSIRVEGDESPDTKTRVFCVLTMRCRNPNCPNYKNTWEEKIEMKIGE